MRTVTQNMLGVRFRCAWICGSGNAGESVCLADEAGFNKVVADLRVLTKLIQVENPDIPLFFCDDSMGSMLIKLYIQLYGDDLAGAVLSGS